MHHDPVSHPELLQASERAGGKPNGRIISMGCLENRVYWVQSDEADDHIIKVYRRDRWSEADLDIEHDFVCELEAQGCEVAAPLDLGDGFTIGHLEREMGPVFTLYIRGSQAECEMNSVSNNARNWGS